LKYNEKEILAELKNEAKRSRAFGMLVKHYRELLYWKIRHIVINHEDANDVLQNTFISIWNKIDGFQHRSQLSTWIYRIAINESLDFLRSKKNSPGPYDSALSRTLLADAYFDGDEVQALLQEAIATLPEVQRVVFNLHYFDEMKYREISQILRTSEGALKASYHLAVMKISAYLKRHD